MFTYVTENATILEWWSDQYIGSNGIQIYSVGSIDNVTSISNPNTYATRVSVTKENGITVIVSRLYITASQQFPTAFVTCRISEQSGSQETKFFKIVPTGVEINKPYYI